MSEVASTQPTQQDAALSATDRPRMRWLTTVDWDKALTDGMIYLLAVGGFYVGYQTLYRMALAVGFPDDQAIVVSALADLAILAYSRKAVQEVNAGRSARIIRTIVAAFSLATFALQLRAAWPDPLAVLFHALPPAVWIIGHEMMLRGKLRNAKAALRAREQAAGLRPAPLPRLRPVWWLLDPYHTFIVWRLTKLWEQPKDEVIRQEATKRKAKDKDIPRAWQGYLLTTPATAPVIVIPAMPNIFKTQTPRNKQPKALPSTPDVQHLRLTTAGQPLASLDLQQRFLDALPAAPVKGIRTTEDSVAYITRVEQLAGEFGVLCTGKFLAHCLNIDPGQVSRLRKKASEPVPLTTGS